MIAPQALNMMNDAMISRLAESFAERVRKEAGPDPEKQIEQAYWIALSRAPSEEERKISVDTVRRLGEAQGAKAPFSAGSSLAAKPEGATSAREVDIPARTALAEFCHTLTNSAAFIYID